MSLNVLYHKFRRWQADPYPKRELTGEKHVCHNCETEGRLAVLPAEFAFSVYC